MRIPTLRLTLTAAALVAATTLSPSLLAAAAPAPHHVARASVAAPAATGVATLKVRGAVREPLRLTRADLAAQPQHTETVSYTASGVPVTATFTGPLLLDVLTAAQPRFDPAIKNDYLRFAVLATATDGYQAVVSWGEFDPGFEAKPVLVAINQDGVDLARPRLVVPGDLKGGRYVSDVIQLRLVDLGS